jgi:hypothetical protein
MQPIIHVVATTFDGTRAAASAAIPLAKGAGARLVLLVPRVVSYATDLENPSEAGTVFAETYERLVHELGGAADVQMCLCRTIDDLIANLAAGRSRVVVGGPVGRWLTSPEERFAGRLTRAGCSVVFAASGANATQRRVAPWAASVAAVGALLAARPAAAQPADATPPWQYGAFVDVGDLFRADVACKPSVPQSRHDAARRPAGSRHGRDLSQKSRG